MIIEIFGPPAVGKTTFARRLADQLNQRGRPARLILSHRPAEIIRPGHGPATPVPLAAMRRLARPACEFLARVGRRNEWGGTSIAAELLELLPPTNLLWSVRLRQYLRRLEGSWRDAAQSNAIVIIDQGFVQAVCSLLLLGGPPATGAVEKALALIPKPDQWIHIGAPPPVLRTRLEARHRAQTWMERRLELSAETSLRSGDIFARLIPILRQQSTPIACLGSGESWLPSDWPAVGESRIAIAGPTDGRMPAW